MITIADAVFIYITFVSGSVAETLRHHGLLSMNCKQRENRVTDRDVLDAVCISGLQIVPRLFNFTVLSSV